MSRVRVVRITATCPECGSPPRIRAAEEVRHVFRIADPEKVLMTYQCHHEDANGKQCRTVYEIKAKHFQQAA